MRILRAAQALFASMLFASGCVVIVGLDKEYGLEETQGSTGSTGGTGGTGGESSASAGGFGGSSVSSGEGSGGSGGIGAGGDTGAGGGAGFGGAGGEGGAGGMGSTVTCDATTTCPVGGLDACCWNRFNIVGACVSGPANNDMCDTSAQGNCDTRIECQTEAQCSTGLCCGDRVNSNQGPFYAEVVCRPACDDITLCDQEGEQGPDCPVIQTQNGPVQSVCKPSTLLPPGFLVCGNP